MALALLCAPAAAWAQLPPGLEVGDRVRLDSPGSDGSRVLARVEQVQPDWIAFRPLDGRLVWTRRAESIDTMAVSRGWPRGREAAWGALWGGYIGASATAIGFILGAHSMRLETGTAAAIGGALGAAGGGLVGAALGALFPRERWTVYVLPPGQR